MSRRPLSGSFDDTRGDTYGTYAERVSGLSPETIGRFFATGMLLNVIASMGLQNLEEPWAARLVGGLKTK